MGLDLWLPFGFRYGPGMLSEVLQPGMGLFKRVLGGDPDNLLYGWHFHPGIFFFPGVPLCSFLKATDHSSGIHFGHHDCLLSIRRIAWENLDDLSHGCYFLQRVLLSPDAFSYT